jgi:predicted phosphodiesterase
MRPKVYAILADIHANYQALKAVEQDATHVARKLQADSLHFVILGDVVDYGPQPNECMNWVTRHADIVVQGNHDMDVADSVYQPPKTVQSRYWPITIWTRMVLEREYRMKLQRWTPGVYKENNRSMPEDLKDFILFHSSLTSGHQGYIDNPRAAWDNLDRLSRRGMMYGLFGHSHVQCYFVDDPLRKRRLTDKTTAMTVISPESSVLETLDGKERWDTVVLRPDPSSEDKRVGCTPWYHLPPYPALFNPGGVGQSRPHGAVKILAAHDNRAAYMMLKSNGNSYYQFRRVPYDVDEAIRHLREDVTWHQDKKGADIFKTKTDTFSRDIWNHSLRSEYRRVFEEMDVLLPELVEKVLVPQLQ